MAQNQSQPYVIIASNRGPVSFSRNDVGDRIMERGSGGLVTALTGLTSHIDVTWISCAMSSEDSLWDEGELNFQDDERKLYIKFISPKDESYNGYYNEIANPILWFLQHSMWDVSRAPVIDRNTWKAWDEGYVVVNRLFAQHIAESIKGFNRPTLIMLQDYHLYLTACNLRHEIKRSQAKILHFIHIPWPGPEYWGILPPKMRQSILDSLCAVDLLGFQTKDDALNFIRTCQSYLPSARVNFRSRTVRYKKNITHVRDFPISIDVQSLRALANAPETQAYEKDLREIVGNRKMILRVDRIEPSKNIIRGFKAFEEMLELHPEHVNAVIFLALLIPSRMDVLEYQDYLDESMAAAGRINAIYGNSEWEPVRLLVADNYPRAVAALKEYDVLLVNSIADGMNLVAKEGPVVNRRNGVLLLSEQTGASQQLSKGALIISPCDVYATAEAMHRGLIMPQKERQKRTDFLRTNVEQEDINAWLEKQLSTLSNLNI
jgi:trehalose 6-phosphate synthase